MTGAGPPPYLSVTGARDALSSGTGEPCHRRSSRHVRVGVCTPLFCMAQSAGALQPVTALVPGSFRGRKSACPGAVARTRPRVLASLSRRATLICPRTLTILSRRAILVCLRALTILAWCVTWPRTHTSLSRRCCTYPSAGARQPVLVCYMATDAHQPVPVCYMATDAHQPVPAPTEPSARTCRLSSRCFLRGETL
uniref:Uncharacterized protein n=1 Tax=Branchiostoma floridae TaxID=7739 RepID=C3ZKF0_BRAFL|eukprot:XP_002591038.1 hypothetical protein BRAFLDRAFT_69409 [Branchiostoma floridae]